MSNRPPVPSLPPLSGIQDKAVRDYLGALSNAWAVRNGHVGDGDEKFLTVKDLKDGVMAASSLGSGGPLGGAGQTLSGGARSVAQMIRDLSDQIQQSALWKTLGARIEQIEMPDWFKGKFGAEIQTEQVKITDATNALAQQTTTAITNVNDNVGLVKLDVKAVSDLAGTTAGTVSSLQAGCGYDPATGKYTTLIKAQQAFDVSADVDGKVKGNWSVKFDSSGYVTGVGLGIEKGAGGSPRSAFFIRADQFAVGPPSGGPIVTDTVDPATSMLPFIVSDGVVYINSAFIKDATITSAKIADAAITSAKIGAASVTSAKIADAAITSAKIGLAEVGTLKIAGDAVTVNRAARWVPSWLGQTQPGVGTWVSPNYQTYYIEGFYQFNRYVLVRADWNFDPGWISPSLFVSYEPGGVPGLVSIIVEVNVFNATGYPSTTFRIGFRKNGVMLDLRDYPLYTAGERLRTTMIFTDTNPTSGESQYQIVLGSYGHVVPESVSALLLSGKR